MLSKRIRDAGAKAYLINTGWNGQGQRISLKNTRALINAVFADEINFSDTDTLLIFNLKMPKTLAGLDASILDPRSSYESPIDWEKRAHHLGGLFIENFSKFTDTTIGKELAAAGPQLS